MIDKVYSDAERIDNLLVWQLFKNTDKYDTTNTTKIVLNIDNQNITSDINPEVFDWLSRDNTITLMLGYLGLSIGTHYATLILYDDNNPNGVQWGTKQITVIS